MISTLNDWIRAFIVSHCNYTNDCVVVLHAIFLLSHLLRKYYNMKTRTLPLLRNGLPFIRKDVAVQSEKGLPFNRNLHITTYFLFEA